MIIYDNCYEREGNDAWLVDYVKLHNDYIGLYLVHHQRWSGWSGDINEDYTLQLDIDDLEESQKKLDNYLGDRDLEDGIEINLEDLINDN